MSDDRHEHRQKTQVFTRMESHTARAEEGGARVVVIQGPELGRLFAVGEAALLIGRSPECDVQLSASGVSRQHCRIERKHDSFQIQDLDSTNHTRINETVIDQAELADGDRIRLGQTVLRFIAPDHPESAWLGRTADPAQHDDPSGLFNRSHFQAHLEAVIDSASASPEETGGGVLYLTLDTPSTLRDQVGMAGLEELVGQMGQRLVDTLSGDHLPARFGEHSLVVLASELDGTGLADLAEGLRDAISTSVFSLKGQEFALSASIGICPFSLRISDADMMLVCAARAAEQAQRTGGNRIETFQPEVSAAAAREDELAVLGLLREALKKNAIQTLFQPAVSTIDGEPAHYHLLPRLLTDDNQLIAAADFIPVATRHGEVQALDRWMSVRALAVIREQLGRGHPMRLFISQSADSLDDLARFEALGRNLEADIADRRLLVIDFRQDELDARLKSARQLLPALRRMGFGVCVSGVGDADRPELLLNHFEIDFVKLTARFAAGIGHDPATSQQFDQLADVFHDAGARILVGWVEDAETMSRIWNSKADLLQGNFIQRPAQTPDFTLGDEEA